MASSAARHSGKKANIVCLAPDVCLTPWEALWCLFPI